MTYFFDLFLAIVIFSSTGLIASFFASKGARLTKRRFRDVYRTRNGALEVNEEQQSMRRFLAERAHWLRMQFRMRGSVTVQERVRQAGYTGTLAYEGYLVSRVLCPAAGVCIGFALPAHKILFFSLLGGFGYLLPTLILGKLIRSYREVVRRSLPDAVDLLVICVDAGLGIDQGLLRVGQELALSHPQIAGELLQIHREQRAGKPRMQAWQDLAIRLPLAELRSFTNMLAQTERFGTPIARALSNFGNEMRQKRKQQAEEQAAKTTVKIIFPLVLFIFPSIFLIILGPALLNIIRGLNGLSR